MVVTQDPTDTTGKSIMTCGAGSAGQGIYQNANPQSLGMVWEGPNTLGSTIISGPNQAGAGFDTSHQSFGNVLTVFSLESNIVDILDQGIGTTSSRSINGGGSAVTQSTSAPFIIGDAFAVGLPLYYTGQGLITIVAPTTSDATYEQFGVCRAYSSATGAQGQQIVTVQIKRGLLVV
jgi:hypothetical protein